MRLGCSLILKWSSDICPSSISIIYNPFFKAIYINCYNRLITCKLVRRVKRILFGEWINRKEPSYRWIVYAEPIVVCSTSPLSVVIFFLSIKSISILPCATFPATFLASVSHFQRTSLHSVEHSPKDNLFFSSEIS